MTLAAGQILQNRYRIISFLSQGGMGAVYRAVHLHLNIAVAIKEMVPQPGLAPAMLAQLRQQFQREAATLAHLDHPHLVGVIDFFEDGGNTYLVMKFIEGESIAEHISRQGALLEREVLTWAGQLLDALAYCHAQGVIHRDVKPQNVIIRPDGRAVLVDFGLVKLWDPRDPRTRTAMRGMGTPEYAPPEQYHPDRGHTDGRADIYGLGATLYHALTGQIPPTATERIASRHAFQRPRTLNPHIPPSTEAVVLQAMELAVEDRFQNTQEMQAALARARADSAGVRTVLARPAPPARAGKRKAIPTWALGLGGVAAAAVAMLALLVGVMLIWRGRGSETTPTPPTAEMVATGPATVTRAVKPTATGLTALPSPAATRQPTRTPTPVPTATATAPSTSTPVRTATSVPTASPIPTKTPPPRPTATPTPVRTATSVPTASPVPTKTPPSRPTATPTPPRAAAPEPLAPAQGATYRNPLTFQWRGTLGAGQAYQVTARHTESGYVLQSGLLTGQSWTTDLPAERFGEWRWTVAVVQGGRTTATSREWMFWFNPSAGGGGGGGDEGPKPTNTPP